MNVLNQLPFDFLSTFVGTMVAVWLTGNALVSINVVALCRGTVSIGMGDHSQVYHLGV